MHYELLLFASLVIAHLLPVWVFRYVPTGDGPSHLANSIILRDYFAPDARQREFFELALAPFPNWTSHLVLAGLSWVMPPLWAEKVLVSGADVSRGRNQSFEQYRQQAAVDQILIWDLSNASSPQGFRVIWATRICTLAKDCESPGTAFPGLYIPLPIALSAMSRR